MCGPVYSSLPPRPQLTRKIDHISRDRPLLGVLSAFGELCLLIKQKSTPCELHDISNKLDREFEADGSLLARLVPNVAVLMISQQAKPAEKGEGKESTMNLHTVLFILQRFLRIVSSCQKPVMLFYDDLQ